MTLAVGFWVLLAGGVMVPGSNDPLAISAPINSSEYSVPLGLPPLKDSTAVLPPTTGGGGRLVPGSGSGAGSRTAPTGRTYGPGSYLRSPTTRPRMMPLAPTDTGATGFMPTPPHRAWNLD